MMDGIKVGIQEDMGDGMTCNDHPYRNNPGGICAFCLQEKLGKLVCSSSTTTFPHPVRVSVSSSSDSPPPPPFRSDIPTSNANKNNITGVVGSSSSASSLAISLSSSVKGHQDDHYGECNTRRARIPFLTAKKKKKMMGTTASAAGGGDIVFKRSKSTITPGRRGGNFLDAHEEGGGGGGERKRGGFWSFLYLSSKSGTSKKIDKSSRNSRNNNVVMPTNGSLKGKENCTEESSFSLSKKSVILEDEDDSPNSQASASVSSFERKVSRSRSVGCGSRSFSGDFFERISTGFGDCTLRRVESQREGKAKVSASTMKERVKCGGIFGGFIMTSSSSSYWISSSAEDMNVKPDAGALVHGRSRSWGWALASPMKAFSKPSSKDGIKKDVLNKKTTPNLDAIPSLLAGRS